MLSILIHVLSGMAVGLVVTALTSAMNMPTPLSLVFNVCSGAVGYFAGMIIAFTRAKLPLLDYRVVDSSALWTAVLACAIHELIRWLWAHRPAQEADGE